MIYILSILLLLGYFIYKAYPWIKAKYLALQLLYGMINAINSPTNNATNTPEISKFVINKTNRSASIMYEHFQKMYIVSIPYDRSQRVRMTSYKAELIYPDGKRLLITQQPGVPYLVSARSLGGESIEITNQEDGKSIIYSGDSIPNYCLEIQ